MNFKDQILFEPNHIFIATLTEDLKNNYFEKYEDAKRLVEEYKKFFEDFMQRMVYFGQKWSQVQSDKIESDVNNKKLQLEVSLLKTFLHLNSKDKQSSEILSASPNCNIKKSRLSNLNQINSKIYYDESFIAQKENIDQFVQVYSSDFSSNMEDDFDQLKSPKRSDVNTPVKIQNSPILNKRKNNLKKSSSVLSNASTTPSTTFNNLTRISSSCSTNLLEKMNEVIDCNKFETEPPVESLESLENTQLSITLSNDVKRKGYDVLSISKTNCSKTEFHEKGKKLRQTTLTLKKIPPLIDLGKIDSYDNCNYEINFKVKTNKMWSETYDCQIHDEKINKDEQKINSNGQNNIPYKNNVEIKKDNFSNSIYVECNESEKDDELVETSPTQKECSKLRNKLGFHKKSEIKQVRVKEPYKINNEAIPNLGSEGSDIFKKSTIKRKISDENYKSDYVQLDKTFTLKAHKDKSIHFNATSKNILLKSQINCISDETYFSLNEGSITKNNTNENDADLTDIQEKMDCATPSTKKKLSSSFDILPGKNKEIPDFAYKETPVRNKNDRAQLQGWDCRDCAKWYDHFPEDERKKRQNLCSKHRGKYKADVLTPESFWNPVFNDTVDTSTD